MHMNATWLTSNVRLAGCKLSPMKTLLAMTTAAIIAATTPASLAADTPCYEMRVYYAAPGKLDALQARFRDHTCKLFEKHGITNIGYFVPIENPNSKLVYFLAFPSRDAAKKLSLIHI